MVVCVNDAFVRRRCDENASKRPVREKKMEN